MVPITTAADFQDAPAAVAGRRPTVGAAGSR